MKKTMILLLSLLFILGGCSKSNESTVYQEIAQMFMDDGNYDAAERVLNKALEKGESEALNSMLDECYDAMLEPQMTEPGGEYYDLSRASGILSSLGMTEEEFRSNCRVLNIKYQDGVEPTPNDLREYPSNYANEWFTTNRAFWVQEKFETSDGYIAYAHNAAQQRIILFDYRDDPYAPTIGENCNIWPYAIFEGVQTVGGDDYICFSLISVEKE